jgi:hypothetical protein
LPLPHTGAPAELKSVEKHAAEPKVEIAEQIKEEIVEVVAQEVVPSIV